MSVLNYLPATIFLDMTSETKQIYEFLYFCLSKVITPDYQVGFINVLYRMINNSITIQDLHHLTANYEISNYIVWKLWMMDDIDKYILVNKLIVDIKSFTYNYSSSISTLSIEKYLAMNITDQFKNNVNISKCNDYSSCIMIFWYLKHLYICYRDDNRESIDLPNILQQFISKITICIKKYSGMYKENLRMIKGVADILYNTIIHNTIIHNTLENNSKDPSIFRQ